jgi:hypothetical protein
VAGFAKIIDGELEDVPEDRFYMKGNLDTVLNAQS